MSETKQEGDFKIKAPKKTEPAAKAPVEQKAEAPVETKSETASFDKDSDTIKLDLGKLKNPQADADTKQEATEVVADQQAEPVQEVEAEVPQQPEPVQAEESFLEEITEEEVVEAAEELEEQVEQALVEADAGVELPENIQKVVEFMNDTGGSLQDYVKLNTDYSQLNESQLLREYYETTRPHLDKEDVDFIMEDKFAFDEDIDEERDIRRKKLAKREELAKAKSHLDGLKSKYYEEIKGGSRLAPEQKKAVDFFNRYTKETQSDINNFVKKFLNENNEMSDAKGYHKGIFTAMNADSIANHFYEQGKADAMKTSISKSKNVQMGARGVHNEVKAPGGWGLRAVDSGDSGSKLKIKSFKHIK